MQLSSQFPAVSQLNVDSLIQTQANQIEWLFNSSSCSLKWDKNRIVNLCLAKNLMDLSYRPLTVSTSSAILTSGNQNNQRNRPNPDPTT